MSELQLPPDHPEFCPAEELKEAKRLSEIAAEVEYLSGCVDFRAGVVELFQKHNAVTETGGWMLFHVDEYAGDNATATLQNRNEILVFLGTGTENKRRPLPMRDVRILTNEHFRMSDGMSYLCVDFSLNDENEAQYFIDVFSHTEDGTITSRDSLAPVFYLNEEGCLVTGNLRPFTPIKSVRRDGGADHEIIIPFGYFDDLPDKIHALEVGKQLIDKIVTLDPVGQTIRRE